MKLRYAAILLLAPALALVAWSETTPTPDPGPPSRQTELYNQGTEALDAERWDKAVQAFSQAAQLDGDRVDGALYWKAYAENRLGRKADAAATLRDLEKRFPASRWASDARALAVEIKGGSAARAVAAAEDDEELKLIALSGLMSSDPARALPLVEKVLAGKGSHEVKQRALFVLAQSGTREGQAVVAEVARGKRNADLREEAIRYLGMNGGGESRKVLEEIYASTTDDEVKERILASYMMAGDRGRILTAARTEKSEELRAAAVRQLGVMGATAELATLYQAEASRDVREAILGAFAVAGDTERLISIARTEKDHELRVEAVRKMGIAGRERTEAALLTLYRTEKDLDVREAAIAALFISGNGHALVELARHETDRELKASIVKRLSTMRSKEATDYLLEILSK